MPTESSKKKNQAERIAKMTPIIAIVGGLAYLFAAYYLIFLPKLGRLVAGGSLDVAPYESRIADERAYQEKVRAQLTRFSTVNPAQREAAMNLVTVEPDVPGIMVQVEEMARRNGVVALSIDATPESLTYSGQRRAARVAMNISGGDYATLKRFLYDMERSRRVFDVQSLVFSPSANSFTLTARAYYLDKTASNSATAKAKASAPAEVAP